MRTSTLFRPWVVWLMAWISKNIWSSIHSDHGFIKTIQRSNTCLWTEYQLVCYLDLQSKKNKLYSGDLNSEHLNSRNIWITNFYLFAIKMPVNSLKFKPSVTPPSSQTTFDLNSKLLVFYSSHDLYNEPFNEQTILDQLNTKLVYSSDPHCPVGIRLSDMSSNQMAKSSLIAKWSVNWMVIWITNKKSGNWMVHRCLITIQLPDFVYSNQMVTWIMDYWKSGDWMFPVTKCLLYIKTA